ncbi:MAG: hypothetical protein K2L38_01360, partial [Dysosmobacter sp.]|nr:hypothetical protein [Dysosmobacter sp.]
MKRRNILKSLARSLATALLALTSLSTAALAYSEPAQFSDWLLSAGGSPQAVEETLAATGTVLG